MTLDKKIDLLKMVSGYGAQTDREESRKKVWANIREIGVTTQYAAQAAGKRAELQAVVRKREFDNYTHVEYGGYRYKIESVGATENTLYIKLILAKGG